MENMNLDLGNGKLIAWIKPNIKQEDFDADYIISKYPSFWSSLEYYCVAECCGLDAYRFHPEDIIEASKSINKDELRNDLQTLINDVILSPLQNVSCSALNHIMIKSVFVQLMGHIIDYL